MTVLYFLYFALLCFSAAVQGARDISDDEYYSLPSAYHLDDYTRCSRITDGIYCVGRFLLKPIQQNNYKYQLMQELTANYLHNYNHTLTYQGLCLTSTCAHIKHQNHTYRFEQCVNEWANTYDMTSSLHEFHYCHTHHDITKLPEIDTPKLAFLSVTAILICLNVIGTLHDYNTRTDQSKRNKLLMAWSMPANWSKIVTFFDFKDPKLQNLETLQGWRFFVRIAILALHVGMLHYIQGAPDLRNLEKKLNTLEGKYVNALCSTVMYFMILSSFLVTYFFLRSRKSLKLSEIPENIIKRLFRLSPVNIYLVAFAATWWADINHSPTWPVLVHTESQTCRKKFWLQVFYLNNIFSVDDTCLIQTWYIAAEFQLYIVLLLILAMFSYFDFTRKTCIRITTGLILAAIVQNYVLGYIFRWKPMDYVGNPEDLFKYFTGVPSFVRNYVAPWGSLPAALSGLLIGYLLFDIQEVGYKLEDKKWFVALYHMSIPIVSLLWPLIGFLKLEEFESPYVVSMYTVAERGVETLFFSIIILGASYGIESPIKNLMSWKGWQPLSRLGLGFFLVHWFVLTYYIVGVPMSIFDKSSLFLQLIGCVVMSYVVSLPITLLLEIPMSRFLHLVFYNCDK